MKKVLATLTPLRKVRPSRKFLLVGGYILVVAALLAVVTWRGFSTNPVEAPPPGAVNTETENEAVLTEPGIPLSRLGGQVTDQAEEALSALALPETPMLWPLEGQILTEHFEVYRIGNQLRANVGVDIEASEGAAVKASWPGVVEHVDNDMRLGWLIQIRHGGGYLTQYANLLEEPYFSLGDEVAAGQVIGKVGQTARLAAQEGPFLQFAVFKDGNPLDPVNTLSPR